MNKLCRICTSIGSRNIFTPQNENGILKLSPLDNLLEKLRYVTMIQIKENDNLPKMICDLCIVQLNVCYNFKRQAVENDYKLRQYLIEKGIGIEIMPENIDTAMTATSSSTTTTTTTASSSTLFYANAITEEISVRVQQEQQLQQLQQEQQQQQLLQHQEQQNSVIPIACIKTEPAELRNEELTNERNDETILTSDVTNDNQLQTTDPMTNLTNNVCDAQSSDSQQLHHHPIKSMVVVNKNSKLIKELENSNNNIDSDYEFIRSYLTHKTLLDFSKSVINPINMIVATGKQKKQNNLSKTATKKQTTKASETTTNMIITRKTAKLKQNQTNELIINETQPNKPQINNDKKQNNYIENVCGYKLRNIKRKNYLNGKIIKYENNQLSKRLKHYELRNKRKIE